MIQGFIWALILWALLILGFAYVIWVLASKESGITKTLGQIVAVLVIIVLLVMLVLACVNGPRMKHRMMGKCMGASGGPACTINHAHCAPGAMQEKGIMRGKKVR